MRTNISAILSVAIATLVLTGQAAPAIGGIPYADRTGAICPTLPVSMAASADTAAAALVPPAPAGFAKTRRGVARTGTFTGTAAVETLSQGSARTNGRKPPKRTASPINEAVQTSTVTACDLDGQIISQEECDEVIAAGRFIEADGEISAADTPYRLMRRLTTAAGPPHEGRPAWPPKREANDHYWTSAY